MVKLRVYMAAAIGRREWCIGFMRGAPVGCHSIATWLTKSTDDDLGKEQLRAWAVTDCMEASRCDVLVTMREEGPVRGGHLVEMGIALGHGIPVLVIGSASVVFDHHPGVSIVETPEEAHGWLQGMLDWKKSVEQQLM